MLVFISPNCDYEVPNEKLAVVATATCRHAFTTPLNKQSSLESEITTGGNYSETPGSS
ncbi:MAG TPA: hypothetical protein VN937_00145 [Blastocatellia bacterium]|nr:hypothetical protein [Blastocatellia bacterium]